MVFSPYFIVKINCLKRSASPSDGSGDILSVFINNSNLQSSVFFIFTLASLVSPGFILVRLNNFVPLGFTSSPISFPII